MPTAMWEFQESLTRRLFIWSALSIAAGVLLILSGSSFWRAFGIQAAAWGLVDAGIALFGRIIAKQRRAQAQSKPEVAPVEAQKLRRLLWINTGLDLVYVTAGVAVVLTLGQNALSWRGHGWGIILQGSFLLLFDGFHALRVPPGRPLLHFQPFIGAQHLPYLWPGGEVPGLGRPAALFVHGFPGTPAEMRPLSEVLRQQGWTVQGPLLPGFGPQINSLEDKRVEDWLQAIQNALQSLQSKHSPVILVGHSMGAALAISLAASQTNSGQGVHRDGNNGYHVNGQPVDGLVLISPFIWEDVLWQRLVLPLLSVILPRYVQPLKRREFSDPEIRRALHDLLPQTDLDDLEIQAALRQTSVPLSIFAEVRRAGLLAYHALPQIHMPTLVFQGSQDQVVRPERTRRLLELFATRPEYLEVTASHNLVDPENPAWVQIQQTFLRYVSDCCNHKPR